MKWTDDDTRRIFFYEQPKVVAIESVYTIGDETRVSQRYYYDIAKGTGSYENPLTATGIHGVGSESTVTYTTLDGRVVEHPEAGICLVRIRLKSVVFGSGFV